MTLHQLRRSHLKSLYEEITKKIVEQLDKGVAPWRSPYFSKIGFPKNFVSQKEYRGINVLLLASQRFTSPFFLTFLQAKDLGGSVKRGEKGHLVVKYGTYKKEESEAAPDATQLRSDQGEKRGYLKAYTVFHASQTEGIEFPSVDDLPELSVTEKTDQARAIVEAMPQRPVIREGSAVPCYCPGEDEVRMPSKDYFLGEAEYAGVLFHELAHSTGHASRLARNSLLKNEGIRARGDTSRQIYAEEELVAEMAACFLNAHAGLKEKLLENSAAYMKNWADALRRKEASSWVVRAASEGQKAADFILGRP